MQNFQDTFETRQRSFIIYQRFFNLHYCMLKSPLTSCMHCFVNVYSKESLNK